MIAGPDSRAQIAIQASQYGGAVPWEVCPPLPPLLIGWLAKIPGMTPESAYAALVWIVFLSSAAAVYNLWRRMGATRALAVQTALVSLLAPSGILAVWERGEIERLLFWKFLPLVFIAIDIFRRKPGFARLMLLPLTLAVMLLARSERVITLDLLALVEWIALLAACRPWIADTARTRLQRAGAAAVFLLVAIVRLASLPQPGALAAMPATLVAQAAEPVLGPVSLAAHIDPGLGKVHALINGDLRPRESVLWLQALGARSVVAPAHGKFARQLQCVAEEQGWCVFDVGGPAPPAVLVSRERFEQLEPVRGLFDVEGLERYLVWAMRPEAVGFEREGDRIEIDAKPGPNDLVLVRVRAGDWTSSTPLERDPIGFAVLDLKNDGATLDFAGELTPLELDEHDYPRILPEGVVEATAYAPPPFRPGMHLAVFGERFRPEASEMQLDGKACAITYASPGQINIKLPDDLAPGEHALMVNSANLYSYSYHFEVTAP